jgi:hypothetical protein
MDTETRDWLLEHYKDAYKVQMDRTDKIRDRVSFMSGLLTPLGGAIFYVILNYPHDDISFSFCFPAIVSLLLFIVAVVQVLYCLGRGYCYSNILTPRQLREYVKKMEDYAASVPAKKVDVLDKIKTNLMNRYCEGASDNLQVNLKRTNLLIQATQISVFSFIMLLLALPNFFVKQIHQENLPTKVIITGPIRVQK